MKGIKIEDDAEFKKQQEQARKEQEAQKKFIEKVKPVADELKELLKDRGFTIQEGLVALKMAGEIITKAANQVKIKKL